MLVLLPVLAGTIIIVGSLLRGGHFNKTLAMTLSIGAVAIGFVQSLFIFNDIRLLGAPYQVDADWFVSSSFKLTIGMLVDNLAAVMLIVVTVVSLLVQIYTHAYMREDPGYSRFYAYLSLFTASMLGLVIATNLFQMYFFWELVGVCSYFLIGFWFYKPSAAAACLKAFVVNRIGDFGFLVGILLFLAYTFGFWTAHPGVGLLTFNDPTGGGVDITGAIRWALDPAHNTGLTVGLLTIISALIFMGPMAKSAQAPLHVWLPDAMEGPTPISALIHAATMVAAGVYMVARAYPIWLNWTNTADPVTQGSASLAIVAWIGGFTAFMAATIALTQNDIKRGLAWSTVSQLGYMFVGLGVGAFTGGIFHLFNHAFFKAMLFLCSGAVIHALHGEQDMQKMGGLRKELPYTHLCFLIGTISISGAPMFSGFFSKDEIIGASATWTGPLGPVLCGVMIITAALTAFYMFRMYFLTFWGEYRGTVHPHAEHGVSPLNAPLLVLAVPSVISGYLGINAAGWANAFANPPVGFETPFGEFAHFGHHPEPVNGLIMLITLAFSATGFYLAYSCYKARTMNLHTSIAQASPGLYQFSFNRWYWDDLYNGTARTLIEFFKGIWWLVDQLIIDNIVNAASKTAKSIGETMRYSENGRGQYYAMVIFGCVAAISLFVYFSDKM
jgi:NAD(P)H-quinone oxidoreductase subunit 5